ncbi:MAG: hypothetical protein FWD84_06375 [Oscillospiraceae bacterium]|nr:hypothetical protein [Oscillospiraceae bacterium]
MSKLDLNTHPNKATYEAAMAALTAAGFQVDPGVVTKGMIQTLVKRDGVPCAQLSIIEAAGGTYAFRGRTIAKGMAETQAKTFVQNLAKVSDEALRGDLKEQGTAAFLYWPEGSDIYAMIGGAPGDIDKAVVPWRQVLAVLRPVLG